MKRFRRDESGATAIEYALIATLISILIIGGASMIGTSTRNSFERVGSGFASR